MLEKLRELLKERGQGIVEYALLLGFVAIVAVGLLGSSGLLEQIEKTLRNVTDTFSRINDIYSST